MEISQKYNQKSLKIALFSWAVLVTTFFISSILFSLISLGLLTIVLNVIFSIPLEVMLFGILGYSVINLRTLTRTKMEDKKEIISNFENKKLDLMLGIVIFNFSFILLSVIGNLIYSITSLGLLIPFFWFMGEYWIISKGLWFLSPMSILAKLIKLPPQFGFTFTVISRKMRI